MIFRDFKALAWRLTRPGAWVGTKLLTVDVFDTCLHRRVHPEAVVTASCREVTRALQGIRLPPLVDVRKARHDAYCRIAEGRAAAGQDFDAPLTDFLPEWLNIAAGDALPPGQGKALSQLIEARELEFERGVTFANEQVPRVLESARAAGVKVVFVSDMYMTREQVRGLLGAHGLDRYFDDGYVSAEVGALKRTGRIFPIVLEKEQVSASAVVHIGDDHEADYHQPRKHGITAYTVSARSMRARRVQQQYDLDRLRHDPSHAGYAIHEAVVSGAALPTAEERFGLEYFGLPIATFAHRLAERCREQQIKRIYFAAREGFALKRAFDAIAPSVLSPREMPESHYMCVSRLTTFIAAAREFSYREVSLGIGNSPTPTLAKLFAPFQLSSEVLQGFADEAGVGSIDERLPPDFAHWPPFHRLVRSAELQQCIAAASEKGRSALRAYLETINFFEPGLTAFVDIGWAGQIQDSLVQAFGDRPDFPGILGMYFGLRRTAFERVIGNASYESVFVNDVHPTWHGTSAFEFVQLLETVCRAPHGTVVGYARRGGRGEVEAVFRSDDQASRQAELKDDELLALFQSGIQTFCERYAELVPVLGIDALPNLGFARALLDIVVRHPTDEMARWLSSLSNVSDLGLTELYTMSATSPERLSLSGLIDYAQAVRKARRESLWVQGVERRLGFLGQQFLNYRRVAGGSMGAVGTPRNTLRASLKVAGGKGRGRAKSAVIKRLAPVRLETQLLARHKDLVRRARIARPVAAAAPRFRPIQSLLVSNALWRWSKSLGERRSVPTLPSGSVGARPLVVRTARGALAWLRGR